MKTIGELRAFLKETNARWEVDPSFADSDPIPRYRTGGKQPNYPRQPEPSTVDGLRDIVGRPEGQNRSRCPGSAPPRPTPAGRSVHRSR